jgi:hypothetical protein
MGNRHHEEEKLSGCTTLPALVIFCFLMAVTVALSTKAPVPHEADTYTLDTRAYVWDTSLEMDTEPSILAAPSEGDRSVPRQLPVQGKDNLTVSISSDILQEARRLKGQIQISQVVEQALSEKIKAIVSPEKAAILRRLRAEKDERRGPIFARGLAEGRHWATDLASWSEIKKNAAHSSTDVAIIDPEDEPGWQFVGKFRPPSEDYATFSVVDDEGNSVWQAGLIQQFWRGWLAGVRSIYDLVADELEEDVPF